MEEMELIHKVENGELDMLGYVMLNPELKEPFSDYARGNGITCPTAADAVRFLKEYEERLYQELPGSPPVPACHRTYQGVRTTA